MTGPDIQQYGARGPLSDPPSLGEYVVVTYADAKKWHDDDVAAARAEEKELRIADASNGIGHWIDCPAKRHDVTAIYRAGLADGVKAAREAVAALMPDTADEGVVLQALAAIDGASEEGRNTG